MKTKQILRHVEERHQLIAMMIWAVSHLMDQSDLVVHVTQKVKKMVHPVNEYVMI